MRGGVVVVLALVACKGGANKTHDAAPTKIDASNYGEDSPFDAADAPAVETKAITIELPAIARKTEHPDALVVARVANGWRIVDASKIAVDKTHVTIPEGESVVAQQIASRAGPAGVLVLADGTVGTVNELAFALNAECWALAGVNGNALVGAWSMPCPAPTSSAKDKQLAVAIDKGRVWVGTRGALDAENRMTEPPQFVGDGMQLRPGFTSLVFAVADDASIDVVLEAIVLMQKDVPATRWVPQAWLPMRFPNGFGADPTPIPQLPPPQPGWGGPPRPVVTVTFSVDKLTVSKNAGLTEDEASRVVRARAGIYRACYQKELNRTPWIKGTFEVAFDVGVPGEVQRVTIKGKATNDAVRECVQRNVARLRFPPKSFPTSVRARFTFASS